MSGSSPAEALDAYLRRFRAAVRCVAEADVFGSTTELEVFGALTLSPRGAEPSNIVPLRMSSGHRDLQIGIYQSYFIEVAGLEPGYYEVRSARYAYEIVDRNERELFVFHWHPSGVSAITFPHLHMSGARPITLPARPDTSVPEPLDINAAHIPTGRIFLEDVIGFLIRDLAVRPRRADWDRILRTNRAAAERMRAW